MKASDFTTTSSQREAASQTLLQTEQTDAVNSGIVGKADKSGSALKGNLYSVGKKAATGGAASAALSAVTNGRKGKPGAASASALASQGVHEALAGSELEGADDLYHGAKGTYRAGKALHSRLSGKGKPADLKATAKSAGKAAARGAVSSAIDGTELEGADTVYDVSKASYHAVRGMKRHLSKGRFGSKNPLASEKPLGKLSEKKSAMKAADTVEAKRKAQATGYFKRNVYTVAEKAKTAAAAKRGFKLFSGSTGNPLSALAGLSSSLFLLLFGFLALLLLLAILSGAAGGGAKNERENGTGSLTGIPLEVAQTLRENGFGTATIAAVLGNIEGESQWNPDAVYAPGDGEYGYGLFQFTDNPEDGTTNYTDFVNWCNANGKQKNSPSAQTEYFLQHLPLSWSTALHQSDYFNFPEYAGRDASYGTWRAITDDVGFATYCMMACYERPNSTYGHNSYYSTRLPAAQRYYQQLTSGTGQDLGDINAKQQAILDAADPKHTPSPGAGWCAKWVSNVYEHAGLPRPGGNADDMYRNFCHSSDRSQLKPGMMIAVDQYLTGDRGSSYAGSTPDGWALSYHVGIYMGNGVVRDNIGDITDTPLDTWIATYGNYHEVRWGFPPGVE